MGIVTKIGDDGTTRTLAGKKISKADPQLELTGAVDELNAAVGFARSLIREAGFLSIAAELREFQLGLFRLGAETSGGIGDTGDDIITDDDVRAIEERIAFHERDLRLPPTFLLPGTTPTEAALEIARTAVRRLERRAIAAKERAMFRNESACRWLNRASDYLFILARVVEREAGVEFDPGTQ